MRSERYRLKRRIRAVIIITPACEPLHLQAILIPQFVLKILYQSFVALLAVLALPFAVHAQANFRPGYIVALKGDTLRGSVDYGSGNRSAYECRFRADNAAAIEKLLPNQLQGYGFPHDRFYQSRRVPAQNPAADTTSERLFLEVLVQGPASLYYLSDINSGNHYYFRSGNSPVQPLVQLSENVTINGSKYTRKNPLFRIALAEAFQACPAVHSKVSELPFASSSLIRIFQQYNACVGGSQIVSAVANAKQRSYFLLEAVAGAQASSLRFDGEIPMKNTPISGGIRPVVGLALQQYLPVWANRFGVRIELLYQTQQYSNEFFAPSAYAYAAYQEVRIKFDQLRVPVLFRYMPLNGRFQPFIEAGVSVAFALNSSNEYRYRAQPTSTYSPWRPILESPRGSEESVLAGLGASALLPNKRHLTAEFRAERTNGFSEAVAITTIINRAYLLLSYDLIKSR